MRWCNAGHTPPVLLAADGSRRRPERHRAAAGRRCGRDLHDRGGAAQPGDLVFACTDGLTEARRDGRQFGDERLDRRCWPSTAARSSPTELVHLLQREAEAWAPVARRRHGHPRGAAGGRDRGRATSRRTRRRRPRCSTSTWSSCASAPGRDMRAAEHIFATAEAFNGPGSAWLVIYDAEQPVACGGLRPLAPGTGEIKRMFVTPPRARRGLRRRLLGRARGDRPRRRAQPDPPAHDRAAARGDRALPQRPATRSSRATSRTATRTTGWRRPLTR